MRHHYGKLRRPARWRSVGRCAPITVIFSGKSGSLDICIGGYWPKADGLVWHAQRQEAAVPSLALPTATCRGIQLPCTVELLTKFGILSLFAE